MVIQAYFFSLREERPQNQESTGHFPLRILVFIIEGNSFFIHNMEFDALSHEISHINSLRFQHEYVIFLEKIQSKYHYSCS